MTAVLDDVFADVIGQTVAVDQLRSCVKRPVHAFLFVGPAGSGKRTAAFAFAAALLDDERARNGVHPDVHIVDREGASITVAQAREISRIAASSPVEGSRKVLVLDDFHLVADAGPALLKTIEEASQSTIFVILAEAVPKELVTVASRCLVIEFRSIAAEIITETLVAEGVEPERARLLAESAHGDLDRARLLSTDDGAVSRGQLWVDLPDRLDGSGNAAAACAIDIVAAIDAASEHLVARQAEEFTRLKERVKDGALSNTAIKNMETEHKRQLRRLRMDELRSGFAGIAREMSRRLQLAPDERAITQIRNALQSLQSANESLDFNPNESLLLNGLFVKLTIDLGR